MDQILIRDYGRLTPEEIGEKTGIDPLEVAKRTEAALGKRDYLSEDAHMKITMLRLESMAEELESRLPNMKDKDVSAAVNSAAGALGRVLKEVREIRRDSEADAAAMEQSYGLAMTRIIERAHDRMLGALSVKYPNVDQDDLKADFQEFILEVAREYDAD